MNRATETEQGLSADAQVLVEVVLEVIVLAGEGEQGDAGGVPHGDPRDDLAEAEPREVHRDTGREPQPGQDGCRGEGRHVAAQVSNRLFSGASAQSLSVQGGASTRIVGLG